MCHPSTAILRGGIVSIKKMVRALNSRHRGNEQSFNKGKLAQHLNNTYLASIVQGMLQFFKKRKKRGGERAMWVTPDIIRFDTSASKFL
jgi:hypothetical protein